MVMIRKLHMHYLNLCICKMRSGTPTCTSLLLSKFCLPLFLLSLMFSFLLLLKVLLWDNKKVYNHFLKCSVKSVLCTEGHFSRQSSRHDTTFP